MDLTNLFNQLTQNLNAMQVRQEQIESPLTMEEIQEDSLNYAMTLADVWLSRARTCIVNLKSCHLQKMKIVELLSIRDEENYPLIDKEMKEIDKINTMIDDIEDILVTHHRKPFPASVVNKIAKYEVYVYRQFMTKKNLQKLLSEIEEANRKVELLNNLLHTIDSMWDNNDTEEEIKECILSTFKKVYTSNTISELRQMSNDFFIDVTHGRNVRVNLSKKQLESLKKEKYPHVNNTSDTCGTCLEEFVLNDDTIVLSCNHRFHPQCIIPWLKTSVVCPTCRKDQRD
jgi:hypothetical protein